MNLVNTPPSKQCQYCKKIYFKKVNVSKKKWNLSKYCSHDCHDKDLIGKPTWNKGLVIDRKKYPNFGRFGPQSEEAKKKMADALEKWRLRTSLEDQNIARTKGRQKAVETGKRNHSYKGTLGRTKELSAIWKGNDASYNSKHKWIQKYWVKTGMCENCGKQPKPFGRRKIGTEWHSLDGKYNREDRNTWIELCKTCHNKFDKEYGA